jgi:hypothetical protein
MRLSAKKFLRKHHEASWALLWNPTRSSLYHPYDAQLHASDETTDIAHKMVFRLEQRRIEQWKNQLKRHHAMRAKLPPDAADNFRKACSFLFSGVMAGSAVGARSL